MKKAMQDNVMKQHKRFVFKFKPVAAMVACTLLLSSGLVLGAPSKRAVAPGEVVPQEDALMQGANASASGGNASAENGALPAVVQDVGGASATQGGVTQPAVVVPSASPEGQGRVVSMHNADDRQYAAVKIVENAVWFKFSEGESYLADGANTALNHIARLKVGQYLVIATYMDPKLKEAENEGLAKSRAENIKEILLGLKISGDRIVMLKPRASQEPHPFALSADRVEVRVEEGNKHAEAEVFK
ncbi:MAG: hypothetical protein ACRCWR_03825 [Saezia sp.]